MARRDGAGFPERISAARDGEEWAWAQLHRELAPALRGYLLGNDIDDADAEVGEIFVVAARTIGDFAGDGDAFKVFLFRIAVDRVRSRSGGPKRRKSKRARGGLGASNDSAYAVTALTPLDPDIRDAILLRRVAKMSVEQTAEVLRIGVDDVIELQTRGLAELKQSVF